MIKKIAMVAFAVSAVLSNAFAADPECSVILGTSSCTFRGTQWTPEVKRVRCGTDDFTEFKSVKYGQNINAGVDAGTVTIELKDGTVINHKFEILQKEVGLKILDYEKELGAENPEFISATMWAPSARLLNLRRLTTRSISLRTIML